MKGVILVRLLRDLWLVSGARLTHPWDASAYLIEGDEPVLIDCGGALGYTALKQSLRSVGYEPGDIRRVLATHGHWDHLSAMALLREESDAELWIHEADHKQVETGDDDLTTAFLYGVPFPQSKVDGLLHDGDVLEAGSIRMEVLHTPGHTRGSVCFLLESSGMNVLVAGDTLFGAYHERIGSNLDSWHRSLDRLCELDVDALTVGHCPPLLLPDGKRRIEEARQQFGVYFNPWFKPFHTEFRY